MIDYFTLALSHGLMAVALWRMMQRADLDREPTPGEDGKPEDGPRGRA